jgi:hypothetical protein
MVQYNCKKQIYAQNGYQNGCGHCIADAVNNPKCPDYEPISLSDFARVGRVIKTLEKEIKNEKR